MLLSYFRAGQALDATLQTVTLTFVTVDTLLAVDVESVGVDFRKRCVCVSYFKFVFVVITFRLSKERDFIF